MSTVSSFICPYPLFNISILYSGIKVCCWHGETLDSKCLSKSTLKELWEDDRLKVVREKLSLGLYQCPSFCPVLNGCSDIFYSGRGLYAANNPENKITNPCVDFKSKGPSIIQLDYTMDCNLTCIMCNNQFERGASLLLSEAKIRNLIIEASDNSPSMKVIMQGGEPFYLDKASGFARRLSRQDLGISWGFITNLLHWAPSLVENLKLAGFVVSIDGGCQRTYEYIRRGASWETLIEKLPQLISFCGTSIPIQINYTVMSSNIKEMYIAAELFHKLGIKLIRYRPVLLPLSHPEFIFSQPCACDLLDEQSQKLLKDYIDLVDAKDFIVLINLAHHFAEITKLGSGYAEDPLGNCLLPISRSFKDLRRCI